MEEPETDTRRIDPLRMMTDLLNQVREHLPPRDPAIDVIREEQEELREELET